MTNCWYKQIPTILTENANAQKMLNGILKAWLVVVNQIMFKAQMEHPAYLPATVCNMPPQQSNKAVVVRKNSPGMEPIAGSSVPKLQMP